MLETSSAYRDLQALCPKIERLADEVINHLDSGYGPRFRIPWWRKKQALRAAREIKNEASLIRRTAVGW